MIEFTVTMLCVSIPCTPYFEGSHVLDTLTSRALGNLFWSSPDASASGGSLAN